MSHPLWPTKGWLKSPQGHLGWLGHPYLASGWFRSPLFNKWWFRPPPKGQIKKNEGLAIGGVWNLLASHGWLIKPPPSFYFIFCFKFLNNISKPFGTSVTFWKVLTWITINFINKTWTKVPSMFIYLFILFFWNVHQCLLDVFKYHLWYFLNQDSHLIMNLTTLFNLSCWRKFLG